MYARIALDRSESTMAAKGDNVVLMRLPATGLIWCDGRGILRGRQEHGTRPGAQFQPQRFRLGVKSLPLGLGAADSEFRGLAVGFAFTGSACGSHGGIMDYFPDSGKMGLPFCRTDITLS